jgi:hypothetical protein
MTYENAIVPSMSGGQLIERNELWHVIVPIERTNLIPDPSFELATSAFQSTPNANLTRTDTMQVSGVYSGRVVASTAGFSVITTRLSVANDLYVLSAYMHAQINTPLIVRVKDENDVIIATRAVRASGYWQRVWLRVDARTLGTRAVIELGIQTNVAQTWFVDAVQFEACTPDLWYPSTYFDGDHALKYDTPGYYWLGAEHASPSVRVANERSGGVARNLRTYYDLQITSFSGGGIAPQNNVTQEIVATGIREYRDTFETTRTIQIVGKLQAVSLEALKRKIARLARDLPSRNVYPAQLLYLQYGVDDYAPCVTIPCMYTGGLDANIASHNELDVTLRFDMIEPYLYGYDVAKSLLAVALAEEATTALIRRTNTAYRALEGLGVNALYFRSGYLVADVPNAVTGFPEMRYVSEYEINSAFPFGRVNLLLVLSDGRVLLSYVASDTSTQADRVAAFNYDTQTIEPLGVQNNEEYPFFGYVVGAVEAIDGSIYVLHRNAELTTNGRYTYFTGTITRYDRVLNRWDQLYVNENEGYHAIHLMPNRRIIIAGRVARYADPPYTEWIELFRVGETDPVEGVLAITSDPYGVVYFAGEMLYFRIGDGPLVVTNDVCRWQGTIEPIGVGLNVIDTALIRNKPKSAMTAVWFNNELWLASSAITRDPTSFLATNITSGYARFNGTQWSYGDVTRTAPVLDVTNQPINPTGIITNANASEITLLEATPDDTYSARFPAPTVVNVPIRTQIESLVVSGSQQLLSVENADTNQRIQFNTTIAQNERARLYFRPLRFIGARGRQLIASVQKTKSLVDFTLQAGVNTLMWYAQNLRNTARVHVTWRQRYASLFEIAIPPKSWEPDVFDTPVAPASPQNVLLDSNGQPILDSNGQPIITD